MSVTQTMRQLPVQQARTYDYLYGKLIYRGRGSFIVMIVACLKLGVHA